MDKNLLACKTPEDVYFYQFNREQRRKHTAEQKKKHMQDLWQRFLKWKQDYQKGMDEAIAQIKTKQEEEPNGQTNSGPSAEQDKEHDQQPNS
jgi:hypothetical protein